MLDKTFYEFKNGDGLFYILVILMTVVMEGNSFAIIFVNAGSSNDWTSKITSYIFSDYLWFTFVGFSMDIEAVFMIFVNGGFNPFKRWT